MTPKYLDELLTDEWRAIAETIARIYNIETDEQYVQSYREETLDAREV